MRHIAKSKLLVVFFFFVIVFITCFLRLFQLGNIPHGFTNDEIVAVYNAYSLWHTHGYGIDGKFLPMTIRGVGNDLTPVPVYILSIFFGAFGLSPFVARLPYALSGIGAVICLFFIIKQILGNRYIALGGMLVFALSPWHLLISRGAWESGVAIFFYLLGIYIFLKTAKKGNILWSLPAFFLGFYSYNAGKIFFLAFIPCLLFLFKDILWIRKKETLLFLTGILLIGVSFLLVLKTAHISRNDILLWQNDGVKQTITKTVDFERAKSSAPHVLQDIYSNKPLFFVKTAVNTYFSFFSPQYLFLTGDTDKANGYGIFSWGQMYLCEIVLLIIGIYVSCTKFSRKSMLLMLCGLLLSPLASALSTSNLENNFLFRSSIAIPFLSFFVGAGLYEICRRFLRMKKILKIVAIGTLIIVYSFFVTLYLYSYYFQFATYGGEFWSQSSRTISAYIQIQQPKYAKIYITTTDKEFFLQYGFFTHAPFAQIQQLWQGKTAHTGNVYFVSDCPTLKRTVDQKQHHVLFITTASCYSNKTATYTVTDTIEPLRIIWQAYEN